MTIYGHKHYTWSHSLVVLSLCWETSSTVKLCWSLRKMDINLATCPPGLRTLVFIQWFLGETYHQAAYGESILPKVRASGCKLWGG